ncbi:MAG: long-chain fatty acid--CoA ligase [Myxococcales bacterium]|nr:long-chain fatty acid--CoA ligase [Myxococcales bacterium]
MTAIASNAATRAADPGHHLQLVQVAATSDLDHLIYREDVFDIPLEEQLALRERFVREALAHHLAGCSDYAAYGARLTPGLDPWRVPLADIPVLPTAVFKGHEVVSVATDEVMKWCLSSGTRGVQSRIGRDRISLERLLGSVRVGLSLIESWLEDDLEVVHLGPDRQEAGDIWFMYVMSLIELIYPTQHYVRGGVLDAEAAISRLVELLQRRDRHIAVVGAPFQIIELAEQIERRRIDVSGGDRVTVFSAGGWKRLSGSQISRASFDAKVMQCFGLLRADQVRDAFNQVELNTVFIECSAHRKHVPPWVYITTRNPDDLKVQPAGTRGVLSYLDASSTSYPAFLVTDDLGIVEEGECPCGRAGVTMRVERRLTRLAERGCALTLDKRSKR